MALADGTQRRNLEQYFSTKDTSESKVEAVKSIFITLDIHQLTSDLMKEYHSKAMHHLDAIESDNKEPLLAFSALLLDRVS